MGDALGSATGIDRLLGPPALSTPNFTLITNDDFWSRHMDLMCKLSKVGAFIFHGYLGEIESDSKI